VLYVVQNILFGGALRTGFIYFLIIPPITWVSWLLYKDDINEKDKDKETEPPGKASKVRKFFHNTIVVVIIVGMFSLAVFSIIMGNPLAGYQMLGFMLLTYIIAKKAKAIPVSLQFTLYNSAILIITFAYLFIARPATITTAKNALLYEGYQNVAYITYYQDEFMLTLLMGAHPNARDAARGLGVYLFIGEMGDVPFGIFVDIASGRSIMRDSLDENSLLSSVIERRLGNDV